MAAYATAEMLRTQYLTQLNKGTADEIAAHDATLDALLERATSIVEAALGFAFAGYDEVATARRVRSYGGAYLLLPPHQPGSVTLLQAGTTNVTTWAETPAGNLEYVADGSCYGVAGWANTVYTVTAKWGYGPPPPSIVEVVCELTVNIWRSRDKGSFVEVIGAQGGGQIKVVGALTGAQREVIEAIKARYHEQAI